jgi:uncharacterized tellurite resistance protein B-like protein
MIDTIRAFLGRHLDTVIDQGDDGQAIRMAIATLLMEVARAHSTTSEAERRAVQRLIETHFALPKDVSQTIAAAAEHEAERATSLYPLTSMVNRECSQQDKRQVVRMLWEVSFADGHLDRHEEHIIRRIADLLHVPHREFIRAKLQVTEEGPGR